MPPLSAAAQQRDGFKQAKYSLQFVCSLYLGHGCIQDASCTYCPRPHVHPLPEVKQPASEKHVQMSRSRMLCGITVFNGYSYISLRSARRAVIETCAWTTTVCEASNPLKQTLMYRIRHMYPNNMCSSYVDILSRSGRRARVQATSTTCYRVCVKQTDEEDQVRMHRSRRICDNHLSNGYNYFQENPVDVLLVVQSVRGLPALPKLQPCMAQAAAIADAGIRTCSPQYYNTSPIQVHTS